MTRIFNSLTDDLQITATKLRSANNLDLQLDTSKNLFIDASNIKLTATDLSTNTIHVDNLNIGGSTLAQYIGSTSADLTGNQDASFNNIDISGSVTLAGGNLSGATTLTASGAITGGSLTDGTATLSGGALSGVTELTLSSNGKIKGPSTMTIDPATHEDNTGTLIIKGNLQVDGTTTTINSTVVDISDKTLVLASNATDSSSADGAGFEISGANVSFLFNDSSTRFVSSIDISAANFIGALSGNAATTTALANARTIGGVSFDGTANINLPGVNTTGNQDTTGSAATLTTPRSINGVSFNGSSDISTVPVSYSSFALKTSDLNDLSNTNLTTEGWQDATGYNLSKTLLSANSLVKMEFKVK